MKSTVTQDELLAELAKALQGKTGGGDGLTLREAAAAMDLQTVGWGMQKVSDAVKELIAAGKVERVRLQRPDLWGTMRSYWGIRVAPSHAKAKAAR